jgi:arylsulfatase A-like enzyme
MLTGLWPHHHGCREVGRPMSESVPATLPEVLGAHGYQSAAVTANGAAGKRQGLHRGFAVFVDAPELPGPRAVHVTRRATQVLEGAARDRPLFLWVHYVDPHFPYSPPKGFGDQPKAPACHQLMARLVHKKTTLSTIQTDRDGASSAALEDCRAMYDAEVAYADQEVGLLLQAWRRARGRGSVIVFSSDHGENLGEDGLFYEHGPSVHDASLRVPLIVAGVGPAGRRDDDVARLEDLPPTLLSLAGVPRERWPAMDGADLSARVKGQPDTDSGEPRAAFAESGSHLKVDSYGAVRSGNQNRETCVNGPRFSLCESRRWPAPRLYDHVADPGRTVDVARRHPEEVRRLAEAARRWPVYETRQRTLRTPRFKLVERPRLEGGYSAALFDLRSDPGEGRDVAAEHAAEVERFRQSLSAWARGIPAAAQSAHTPEEMEQLQALGYID